MGISNEVFQQERGEAGIPAPDVCDTIPDPNDTTNFDSTTLPGVVNDVTEFADFMAVSRWRSYCSTGCDKAALFRRGGSATCAT
jgi:hypothetical protein